MVMLADETQIMCLRDREVGKGVRGGFQVVECGLVIEWTVTNGLCAGTAQT